MNDWVVGVDLGGTKIEIDLVNSRNEIIGRRRIPTNPWEGPASVVERIAANVRELESLLPAGQRIAAMGICSPGPVDHETGTLIDPPNLAGLHHTPLRQMLSERLNIVVSLEHDAKAAGLGEYYYGAGRGEPSMVYVVVGTGVGGAIIAEGKLLRGPDAGKFILLNQANRTRTELTTEDVSAVLKQLQLRAAANPDPVVKFLADPQFQQRFDEATGELTLSSTMVSYRLVLSTGERDSAGQCPHPHRR